MNEDIYGIRERIATLETKVEHMHDCIHNSKDELKLELKEFRDDLAPVIKDVGNLKNTKIFVAGMAAGISTLFGIVGTLLTVLFKVKAGQ